MATGLEPFRRAGSALLLLATLAGAVPARAETPVERGSYLVNTVMTCGNCHTPKGPNGPRMDTAFSGGMVFNKPAFKVQAANITSDRDTGIGAWTDAELKRVIWTGIRPNGVAIAPVMPTAFYGIITDPDMDAIVAYLRTIKPVVNAVQAPEYILPADHEVYPGTGQPPATGNGGSPVQRGFYLASIAHCMECHTAIKNGVHEFSTRPGAGGQEFAGPWGVSVSANITSDPEHGLGHWADDEIKRAITQGVSRDGRLLHPPMGYASYSKMTGADLDAIVAWLRTVPPQN